MLQTCARNLHLKVQTHILTLYITQKQTTVTHRANCRRATLLRLAFKPTKIIPKKKYDTNRYADMNQMHPILNQECFSFGCLMLANCTQLAPCSPGFLLVHNQYKSLNSIVNAQKHKMAPTTRDQEALDKSLAICMEQNYQIQAKFGHDHDMSVVEMKSHVKTTRD